MNAPTLYLTPPTIVAAGLVLVWMFLAAISTWAAVKLHFALKGHGSLDLKNIGGGFGNVLSRYEMSHSLGLLFLLVFLVATLAGVAVTSTNRILDAFSRQAPGDVESQRKVTQELEILRKKLETLSGSPCAGVPCPAQVSPSSPNNRQKKP